MAILPVGALLRSASPDAGKLRRFTEAPLQGGIDSNYLHPLQLRLIPCRSIQLDRRRGDRVQIGVATVQRDPGAIQS